MPSGQASRNCSSRVACPVVHAGVEPQFLGHKPALLRPAGHPHHPAAHDLADLARHRAGGSGSGRHHQSLARTGLADVEQAPVGGHPSGAEHAGERLQRKPKFHGDALGPVQHRVFLPDQPAGDHFAGLELRMAGLDHRAPCPSPHGLTYSDGSHVGVDIAHPNPMGGVHRQKRVAHQQLTLAGLGNREFGQLQVGSGDIALRSSPQNPPTVSLAAHAATPLITGTPYGLITSLSS